VWFGEATVNHDFGGFMFLGYENGVFGTSLGYFWLPLTLVVGVLLLFLTLHLARGIGYLHGQFAKHLLVKTSQYD
jgi:EamA domain-containing membrane protein RarD